MKKIKSNERKKRYREKIALIDERLVDVETLLPEVDDKIKKLACYKAFQEIAEAFFDLAAMKLKDKAQLVKDDYTNVECLKNVKLITEEEAKILREVNGLRNRIVHEYNDMDAVIAKESMIRLLPHLTKMVEKFENHKNQKT